MLLVGTASTAESGQSVPGEVDALIQEGRSLGLVFFDTDDKQSKKRSKNSLNRAEKLLKNALKQNRGCQACTEKLVEVYFYKVYFNHDRNYNKCIKAASKGLDSFPESERLAYFKGYAHYNAEQYSEAIQSLKDYLDADPGDLAAVANAEQLVRESQEHFLTGWYNQADFYNSDESRLAFLNTETYQMQTAFQVTPEWELELGTKGLQALTAQARKLEDSEIENYLQELVGRLVSGTPGPGFDYQVTVVDSAEVNAVTPPGHIIVYTGLLDFAETESELAAVLSHELAHNYAHHQARAVIEAYHAQALANAVVRALNPQKIWTQMLAQIGTGCRRRHLQPGLQSLRGRRSRPLRHPHPVQRRLRPHRRNEVFRQAQRAEPQGAGQVLEHTSENAGPCRQLDGVYRELSRASGKPS